MKKLALFLALFLAISIPAFAEITPPTFESKSVVVASLSTSQVLFSTNAEERFPPGALTQIMTAIVALDKLDNEQTITIKDNFNTYIKQGDSFVNIKAGEQWTVKELVHAMIVGNGDDVALALALEVSSDMNAFVALMNERAKQMGLANTKFASAKPANDSANHYTTASDMAIIAREAYTKPTLKSALSSKTYVLKATEQEKERALRTNNYLLDNYIRRQYYYANVTGGKTGYLGTNTCNCIEFAKKGDNEILTVVMGGKMENEKISSLTDAKTALEFAFNNFTYTKVISQGEILADIKLGNAKGRDVLTLAADYAVGIFAENGVTDAPTKSIKIEDKKIKAPVKKGEVFGEVDVDYLGKDVASVPLVSSENISATSGGKISTGISWFFSSWIFKTLIVLVILWFGYVFLYANPKKQRELRRQKRKQMIEDRLRNKKQD